MSQIRKRMHERMAQLPYIKGKQLGFDNFDRDYPASERADSIRVRNSGEYPKSQIQSELTDFGYYE